MPCMAEAKVKAISAPSSPSSALPAPTKFTVKNVIRKVVLTLFIGASFSCPHHRSLSCELLFYRAVWSPGLSVRFMNAQMVGWRDFYMDPSRTGSDPQDKG